MDNWVFEQIASQGDQTAIIFNDQEYSYTHLSTTIYQYYLQLQENVAQGNIVAIVSDYNFESIALFFALYRNGNIIVPITTKIESEINDRLSVSGCDYVIKIKDSNLQIVKRENVDKSHFLVSQLQNEGKSGLILFSSGSTGAPKAMIHNLNNLIDSYKNRKGKKLVFLIFLMFDHIGGLNTMLSCVATGITMVFPLDRNPDSVCRLIEKYKVNVLPASPTFLNLILISESHLKYDLSSLRMITYGTEPMPESLLHKLKETFSRVKFLQTFGTSETGITGTSSKSSDSTYLKIDDPNTDYKIVDNELWMRSKTQILGYLNSSMERFTEDGWFKTGDLVEQTNDGYMKIVGRNKEMINVGGEKVLPSEVESVLFQMPEIMDCIVFGETNPIIGQIVVAKVLFNGDIKSSEAKKRIATFCSDKLDRYKIPAKVILMAESEFSDRFKKKRL
ncbi:Long-chain-fatty-acid--CoA ligase [termite gut metagenome]|uniref:Long-chain-fatty-acid--CoA ligase n=1 Tax=termite gut metagenome TaxID=433724 RepID=A0A5J4SLL7_9ZZZZ